MLLAGDVGGTKTLLGIYDRGTTRPSSLEVHCYPTIDFENLSTMIAKFLKTVPSLGTIDAACFGVAGPVRDGVAELTNVPWRINASQIADRFSIPAVSLLNDLVAMGYAISVLTPGELEVLQPGRPVASANRALIAPGTGLGEALLHNINGHFVPSPSEGGHADFAPRTTREVQLLKALVARFGRASYEHVLSGPGLTNIHAFVHQAEHCRGVPPGRPSSDLPALITASALGRRCEKCVETLDVFVGVLGTEAGNLGLRCVATAGVFLGGGIPLKILPALQTRTFLEAFRAKPPMSALAADMPVGVIRARHPALLGAAVAAARLAGERE